jgi:hypothetical protein
MRILTFSHVFFLISKKNNTPHRYRWLNSCDVWYSLIGDGTDNYKKSTVNVVYPEVFQRI